VASALEGVAQLTAQFNELGVKFASRELRGSVKDALTEAEHRARSRMPQGTEPHKTYRGRLVSPGYAISTLHIETGIDKRAGAAFAALGVGREAFYEVQFQELGTAFHAAQPWLVPSFEESEPAMLENLKGSMIKRLEKVAKSKARASQRARLARR
jgi:HK97 gp10 family phage protein